MKGRAPALAWAAPVVAAAVLLPATAGWTPPTRVWGIAFGLLLGLKVPTTWAAVRGGARPGALRLLLWTAWPGTDGDAVLGARAPGPLPGRWASGTAWLVSATLLAGLVVPRIPAAGWRTGLGLPVLLAGAFLGVLALGTSAWRRAGVPAAFLFDAPWRAPTLGAFWGRRWNRGFHDAARAGLYEPWSRRWGPGAAAFAVFVVSGLAHEAVLSVPARGGWGLPTTYFLIQGAALLFGRSRAGRRLGLHRGPRARAFAWLVVLGASPLAFHEPFRLRVVLPWLDALAW